jgi:hypothetical protein
VKKNMICILLMGAHHTFPIKGSLPFENLIKGSIIFIEERSTPLIVPSMPQHYSSQIMAQNENSIDKLSAAPIVLLV